MTNPFASDTEREMRTAIVQRLRLLLPSARIIHELNVEGGAVRADIAAVTEEQLYLFEIKSALDKLHRLSRQIQYFHPVCHGLVVVADEKWCGRAAEYPNCDARKVIAFHGAGHLWQWPEPESRWGEGAWTLPRTTPPWPLRMLRLLWADEIRAVAERTGLGLGGKAPAYKLAPHLAASLTGEAVSTAVCRALRARVFAEADDPVFSAEAAA